MITLNPERVTTVRDWNLGCVIGVLLSLVLYLLIWRALEQFSSKGNTMKPACPKCQRFFRPKRNGTPFIEMYPNSSDQRAEPGTATPEAWRPYKLWHGDLWVCHGCGAEIIVGTGHQPISEHYMPDFEKAVASFGATIKINDC